MEKAKVFKGKFGNYNVVKVQFELEFCVGDDVELTPEQVKRMINKEDRIELGETVLNFLKDALVITK